MRKVQGLAALVLALASATPSLADGYRNRSHTTGFSLPGVHSPSGNDEVRAADGTTCRSALGHRGAYVDVGGVASESDGSFGDAAVYGRVIIPLGRKPSRIDCSRLYELEMERLRMEVDSMRRAIAAGNDPTRGSATGVSVTVKAGVDEAEFDRVFGYEAYEQSSNASPATVPSNETVAAIAPTVPARADDAREPTVPARDAGAFDAAFAAPGKPPADMDPTGRFDVPTASGGAVTREALAPELEERWLLPFAGPVPKRRPAIAQARSVAPSAPSVVEPTVPVRNAPQAVTLSAETLKVAPATAVSAVPELPVGPLKTYDRAGTASVEANGYEWPFAATTTPAVDPSVTNAIAVNQTTLTDLEVIAQTRAASRGLPTVDGGEGWADEMFSGPAR